MPEPKNYDEVLKRALERKTLGESAEADNRALALKDLKMLKGGDNMWPASEVERRNRAGRPVLSFPYLPSIVRQITGDAKQNEVTIRTRAVDSEGDIEIAKIYDGIIKEIAYRSKAQDIFSDALEHPAKCGWPGYVQVTTEYADDNSFDQVLRINSIFNNFSVILDPNAKDVTGSDAEWFMIFDKIPKDVFEERFPGKTSNGFAIAGTDNTGWFQSDGVTYAAYWEKTKEKSILAEVDLQDGNEPVAINLDDVKRSEIKLAGGIILREREIETPKWTQYLISGSETLEEPKEWVGTLCPLVRCCGDVLNDNGKVVYQSAIRHSLDAQILVNFVETSKAEHLMLSPKAKRMGTAQQFDGHEDEWDTAHLNPSMRLTVNADPMMPGFPQEINPVPIPSGLSEMAADAKDMVFKTSGVDYASLGYKSNETSAKAINARVREGDTGTFVYHDNQHRMIAQVGRVLVDAIPRIYDTARIVRIRNFDNTETEIPVNQPVMKDDKGNYSPVSPDMPQAITLDMSQGKYDVWIDVGPSYGTARQEAAELLQGYMNSIGPEGAKYADIYFKNLDIQGAEEAMERARKLLPPGLADEGEGDPQQMLAMQKMKAEQEAAQMEMEMRHAEMQMKQQELQIKMEEAAIKRFEAETDRLRVEIEASRPQAPSGTA